VRLWKWISVSLIFSIIVSATLSILQYTPRMERNPDTYYFSLQEFFVIYMYYTAPVFIVIAIFAFIIFRVMEKRKHTPWKNAVFSTLFAIIVTAAGIFIWMDGSKSETNDIYLLPEGYEGEVYVFYNVKGAPELETEDGYEVHVINEEGYFATSAPDLDYGTVTDKYYYVDDAGNRTPIDENCISLFGTGATQREGYEIIYTGFKLTKDNCSEEFMTTAFPMEKEEHLISKLFQQFY